jgi:flavin-dependent dehydrogenase
MTHRRRLDTFLAEQAAEAGAVFREGVTVEGLTIGPDGPCIGTAEVRQGAAMYKVMAGTRISAPRSTTSRGS